MTSDPKLPARVAFGPFQLDVSSGELRKHGTRLRLTGHSLQILEVLLERPHQVVAREELQQRLWNGTTFVDFNHGLNAAINKLRQTLGDSADQPRYVETVPGKGYRFVAPLSHDSLPPPAPIAATNLSPEVSVTVAPPEVENNGSVPDSNGISPEVVVTRPSPSWTRTAWFRVALVLGIGIAIAACAWFFARFSRTRTEATSSVAQPVRYQIALPEGTELPPDQLFSLSPDGKNLAYFARKIGTAPFFLWIQSLDSIKPRSLPVHQAAGFAFWSPDSKRIAFESEGKLKMADLSGSPAQEIGPGPGTLGAAWGRNGIMIYGTETSAIKRLDVATGDVAPVTVRDAASERVHIFPVFLPDGRHFLYSRISSNVSRTGVYIGSLDVKPEEQSLTPLIGTPFASQFAASDDGNGFILFQREATLWAQKYDTSLLRLMGEPRIVAEGVGNTRAFGFFAASSGVLIHRSGVTHIAQLTWVDRRGQSLGTLGTAVDPFDNPPRISPDGSKVAMTRLGRENTDIWIHDLARDVTQRLTFDPAIDQTPVWSPDGRKLVFSSARNGHFDLYQISSNGEGGQELLYASSADKYASSWSADSRFVLFSTNRQDGIWLLPLEGTGQHNAVPLLQNQANERSGVFSPDSRWIAYVSNESGQPEVYVQRFSFPSSNSPSGPKVLVSRGGGSSPRWRADGKEIFYRASDGKLMAVPIAADSALRLALPRALFHADRLWEVAGDGNRFLVSVPVEQGVPPFTVILNWQSALKN
jgi:Tol biopolymer transport system component/DNA-binding winged helix-turn-helix (wHTH) protein